MASHCHSSLASAYRNDHLEEEQSREIRGGVTMKYRPKEEEEEEEEESDVRRRRRRRGSMSR